MPNSTLWIFLLSTIVLSSCGKNNKAKVAETIGFSDKIKHISMPDTDSILPEWSRVNVVVNHVVGDPDNLHPTNGRNTSRSWVLQYTSNYILRSDLLNLSVCPDLAEDMPKISEDKLSYTYTLRKDARWDDGNPITAEDAIFMLKANKCPLTSNPSTKGHLKILKQ